MLESQEAPGFLAPRLSLSYPLRGLPTRKEYLYQGKL